MSAPDVCVVHLVRRANGLAPLQAFLDSYRAHPPGMAHAWLFILKDFADAELAPVDALLQALPHRRLRTDDRGFDLGPYFRAAHEFDHRHFVFLNSFARIRCDGWLAKLYAHVDAPGVGAVGATGSWETLRKDVARRYRNRHWSRRLAAQLREGLKRQHFPPFPNPHLRSNAFMAARTTLIRVEVPPLEDKQDAHRFESGLHGISAQIRGLELDLRVVGCDGRAYAPAEWARSGTFRQDDQANLLVSDNQTEIYQQADAATRARLQDIAWGDAASRPAAPSPP